MIQLIFILLCSIMFGFRLSRRLLTSTDIVGHLVVGWLVGFGLYIMMMYFMGIAHIAWSPVNLLLLAAIEGILSIFIHPRGKIRALTTFDHYAYAAFLVLSIFSLIVNLFWPIRDWDALTLYDFRAVVFSASHLVSDIFNTELNYYLAYPFFTTLVHTLSYTFGFSHPAVYYSLIYYSLLAFMYGFLKKNLNPKLTLILVIIMGITHDVFQHGFVAYTNLPYTVYFTVGILLLTQAFMENAYYLAFLSSLLFGISVHIRYDDPFWVIPIILSVFFSIYHKTYKWILAVIVPILFFRESWILYKNFLFRANSFQVAGSGKLNLNQFLDVNLLIHRFLEVMSFLYQSLWTHYGFLIVLNLFCIILVYRHLNLALKILYSVIFLILGILISGTFALSFLYSKWNVVGGSVVRMMMVFYPLSLTVSGIAIARFLEIRFNHKK